MEEAALLMTSLTRKVWKVRMGWSSLYVYLQTDTGCAQQPGLLFVRDPDMQSTGAGAVQQVRIS